MNELIDEWASKRGISEFSIHAVAKQDFFNYAFYSI